MSVLIQLAFFIPLIVLQFKLAQRLKHENSWYAFIPILNVIQLLEMGRVSAWWVLINAIPFIGFLPFLFFLGKAYFNISERGGERPLFGLLLFVPFVNYWAMYRLINNSHVYVENHDEASVASVIIKGEEEEGLQDSEIQSQAIAQGVPIEIFQRSLEKAKIAHALGVPIVTEESKVTSRGIIWALFFFPLLLFAVSIPFLINILVDFSMGR